MLDAAYLIPAFPLLGFVAILLVGSRLKEPLAGIIATLACAGAFAATVVTFFALWAEDEGKRHVTKEVFTWIPSVGVKVAFLLDPLSITMALFVTGVGSLIHLFAIAYMHGDPRYHRFFLYLNLFIVSMLLLVLGDSFLLLFVGWEGVGACSYLLISFWFERPSASTAAKKAFIANRVGDVGLMLAMFLIFSKVGSLTFGPVFKAVEEGVFGKSTVFAIGLLLFLGACGKSAQLPLSIWLPDAMEGPTPVSALIHAATMVTAGVYLMVRVNPFFAVDARALTVVAWVGVITAVWAALVATSQDDIKRVLAYSTISQLGYMFLAVGSRAYVAAIFHMVTHAFFKALMFLGSGSVIHGMHEQQDMKRMGGLRKVMPYTAYTFLIGWLAIAGVFPLAGFWSKDEILLSALKSFHGPQGVALYALGLITAVITAYYMTRQIQLVFFGDPRWNEEPKKDKKKKTKAKAAEADEHAHEHVHAIEPHESPWPMTVPLVVLAGLAVVGGAINAPWPGRFAYPLEHWLEPVIEAGAPLHLHAGSLTKVIFSVVATAAALAGIGAGLAVWRKGADQPELEPVVLRRAFYYDVAVSEVVGGPGRLVAQAAANTDKELVDGAVGGVARLVQATGGELRKLQTGYVRNYALGLTAGTVVLLAYVLSRGV
jgi:NADH-quinone oxidoreductase subunit L